MTEEELKELAGKDTSDILEFFGLIEDILEGEDKENFRKIKDAYADYLRSSS